MSTHHWLLLRQTVSLSQGEKSGGRRIKWSWFTVDRASLSCFVKSHALITDLGSASKAHAATGNETSGIALSDINAKRSFKRSSFIAARNSAIVALTMENVPHVVRTGFSISRPAKTPTCGGVSGSALT